MSGGSEAGSPSGQAAPGVSRCRAPFVAMEFDPFGDVLACCANTLFPLGNVTRNSLEEIWAGPRAETLRAALRADDLSFGCGVCRYRLEYGHGELAMEYYDHFPMPSEPTAWPYSLQFSLHNTCNLACVMCGAERSSRIRTQRSHLPPLPHVYGDAFFEQIVPFLHHAGAVDFSGGEPFLIPEHGRLWDLLIEMENRPLCSLTTNGTVWNARTERVLAELDTHISVSVDGMTAETFESIRIGADFETVMANLERFLAYTRERGTNLTMSWSLVRGNWFELGAAARFAEERGIHLKVQTVMEPEFGLQRMETEELRHVVACLEAEGEFLLDELDLNRPMWVREVERLREELEVRERPGLRVLCAEPAGPGNVDHVVALLLDVEGRVVPDVAAEAVIDRSAADLRRWCSTGRVGRFDLDAAGRVVGGEVEVALPGIRTVLDAAPDVRVATMIRAYETELDGAVSIIDEWPEADRLVQTLAIGASDRDKTVLVVKLVTVAAESGALTLLVAADASLLPSDPTVVPVNLGASRARGTLAASP